MIFSLLSLFYFLTPASGQLIYGLSGDALISFDASLPSAILSNNSISGVAANHTLVGLDSRPATGQLYALGYNQTSGEAQLYTLNPSTGAATAIGTAVTLAANLGRVSFDFNPTVDRIRVTGSNNANYRLHPVTGALAATDGSLAFAAGDVNDGMNPSIGAVAYTNSYIGATATTLYNYDDSLNVLTSQIPPNNGTLNTIGATGIVLNLADLTGDLDIFFDSETSSNIAFLAANVFSFDALYTIDLATGFATSAGLIGNGISVNDITAFIDRSFPAEVTGQLMYGLTSNNNLISFDSDMPGIIRTSVAVTGVVAGQVLSGMDSRPATGEIFALGYNQTTGEAQLYTLNAMSGVATSVGAAVTLVANIGRIGFDFNPTVDRIRVTGSNNANFRLNPNNGALAATDGALAFAAGDINDGMNPSIGAVAYTNSYIGTTATTLYNYDDSLNVLTSQIPPNNGTLNTIGATGIVLNLTDLTGDLDIFFDSETSSNIAFLSANVVSFDALYTINLATGLATSIGLIGNGISVNDITAFIDRSIPDEVNGQLVYALTSNNNLVSFDSDAPQVIRTSVALTGILTGQTWAGLDFRPATGELYGLGYNSTTSEAQLYVIDPQNGAANTIGAASMLDLGTGDIGFDFNPTVDRIRVVGANNNNYRLHPVTGALAATDGSLAFAAGDVNFGADPLVGAVAYTNSFNGATTTTLYNYESLLNIITTQIPPNNGVLNTIGASGILLNPADASADIDIYYDVVAGANLAYLSANPVGTSNDNFYALSLATGSASLVGSIGNGIATRDMAVFIDSVLIVGTEDIALNVSGFNAYPNPASTLTYLGFELDRATDVQLIATDATGRIVATIFNGNLPSGKFETDWNIENSLPTGLYFVHLYTGNALRASTKVMVTKR